MGLVKKAGDDFLKYAEDHHLKFEDFRDFVSSLVNFVYREYDNDKLDEETDTPDWENILEVIRNYEQPGTIHFNMFPKTIKTMEDLLDFRDYVYRAFNGEDAFIKRNCRDCGKNYYIFISEARFYEERGFPLPKRCKSCRNDRKMHAKHVAVEEQREEFAGLAKESNG